MNIPLSDEYVQSGLNTLFLTVTDTTSFSTIATLVAVILLLIACSALFSGSEVAFFSLQADQIDDIKAEGEKRSKAVIELLDQPKYLLSTLLIANNTVNIGIIISSSYLMNILFTNFEFPGWMTFLIEVVLITSILLILGEIAPKVYATNNNKSMSLSMAQPILFISKLVRPISNVLVSSGNLIEKRLSNQETNVSLDEWNQAIDLTTDDTEEISEQKRILKGLVKFGNISVKQIMCDRTNVTALDSKSSFKDLIPIIRDSGYSRIPVYEDSFDNIKGILYTKDLLEVDNEDENVDWHSLLRKPIFVPEMKKISNLLKDFKQKKVHLAIVVDEYGGTSGIVTLEDILEEIVGDIKDEFDDEQIEYIKVNDKEFIFEGKTQLNDITGFLGLEANFFEDVPEADSLAGLILEMAGHIPKYKSKFNYKHFIFTVDSVGKKSINRIRLTIQDEEKDKE